MKNTMPYLMGCIALLLLLAIGIRVSFVDAELPVEAVIWFVIVALAAISLRRQPGPLEGGNLREFATSLDSLPVGVVATNAEGSISIFNLAAERVFGYAAPEIVGRSVTELAPEFSRKALDENFRRQIQTGELAEPREFVAQRKDGEVFATQVGFSEIAIDGEQYFLAAIQDLSRTKDLENQLAQTRRMEAVGGLTGGIAHDFNNILHIVISSIELLQVTEASDDREKLQDEALGAALRGRDLIRKLMVFSRVRSADRSVTDVPRLVAAMRDLVTRTIGEHIEVSMDLDESASPVFVDSGTLENVIVNLCINSRDAMPLGGRLVVSVRGADVDSVDYLGNPFSGKFTVLSVSDTGIGMSKALVERIFDPYFSTKTVGEGSGLGLSVVYGFVRESYGHITVDSEPGKGTTVALHLPIHNEGLDDIVAQPLDEATERGSGERILVVEDDDEVRKITVRLLSSLGFDVTEAGDGPSALKKLEELDREDVTVDLVLSDVVMPLGMSGIDLSIAIWGRYPDTPVLLCSGYPDQVLRDAGLTEEDIRQLRLIRKPFSKSSLVRDVNAALAERGA